MSVIKYRQNDGSWKTIAPINQIVEVIKEVGADSNKEWREIEVTGDSNGNFDCSAAGINLLETEDWVFFGNGKGSYFGDYGYFRPITYNNYAPIPFIITPIFARLQGENMSNNFERIGLYTFNVDVYGYKGLGSDLFTRKDYAVAMESGVSTSNYQRVYSDRIYIKNDSDRTINSTGRLIYLADKEA